jgi:hypothetical protein
MHREWSSTKKFFSILLVFFGIIGGFFVLPHLAAAATVNLGLTPEVGNAIGLGTTDIRVIVARIIRNFFALLGIIAVVLILYGGFLWMTSNGEEGQIDKAKRVILNAVIGLAIILSAVAITQFILSRLLEATGAYTPGGSAGGGAGYIPKSGSLGQGIIEYHYPERGQSNVARNTRIVITFKQEMDIASLIAGYDPNDLASSTKHDLRNDVVRIYKQTDGPAAALTSTEVQVYYTPDHRTFVFHTPLLGSPTEDVPYIVDLAGGDTGLRAIVGGQSVPAFDGSFASGYQWDFTTGTFIDTTPPKVSSVLPYQSSKNPRNTIVQITFNEPVDPTTVTGAAPGFTNLSVADSGTVVAGTFAVGNRYRTVEFTSDDLCGTNSCGGNVYCLPGNATIDAIAKAATLGTTPPQADPTLVPADGVTDMVGNSLDGNGDGFAKGPGEDDYTWNFSTDNTIDLIPPVIQALNPDKDVANVLQEKAVTATFDKLMSFLSFNSTAVTLGALPTPPEPTCFVLSGANVDALGNVVTSTVPTASQLQIDHCLFYPETNYIPTITSKVQDLHQNCYLPGARQAPSSCDPVTMAAGNYTYCCNETPCATACVLSGATAICP